MCLSRFQPYAAVNFFAITQHGELAPRHNCFEVQLGGNIFGLSDDDDDDDDYFYYYYYFLLLLLLLMLLLLSLLLLLLWL